MIHDTHLRPLFSTALSRLFEAMQRWKHQGNSKKSDRKKSWRYDSANRKSRQIKSLICLKCMWKLVVVHSKLRPATRQPKKTIISPWFFFHQSIPQSIGAAHYCIMRRMRRSSLLIVWSWFEQWSHWRPPRPQMYQYQKHTCPRVPHRTVVFGTLWHGCRNGVFVFFPTFFSLHHFGMGFLFACFALPKGLVM